MRGGRRSERYCCSSKTAACSSALPAAAGFRSSGTIRRPSPSPAGDGPRATAHSSGQTTLRTTRRQGTTAESYSLASGGDEAAARTRPPALQLEQRGGGG